ncbi:MAG TPA: hypothetical protein VFM18_09320 [Methanosarcina sp.]|nr:hypothetical protein [Methanosarcina sp.]
MKRKARKGEFVCSCRAYKFPHRFGGGRCTGAFIAEQTWNENFGTGNCADCVNLNNDNIPYCEVVEGQEKITECPVWQEFVQFNEVKIYK